MRVSSSEKGCSAASPHPFILRLLYPTRGTISAESGAVDFDVDGWREVYVMSRFLREQVTMPGPRMPSAGLLSLSRTVMPCRSFFVCCCRMNAPCTGNRAVQWTS